MSIEPTNLPIYFQKFTVVLDPPTSSLDYTLISALPTNSPLNRLWNFVFRGTMTASPLVFVIDFSNVEPDDYFITFEGRLSGTLEMYGKVYSAGCYLSYAFDPVQKTVVLRMTNPRSEEPFPDKGNAFSFQIFINDDGQKTTTPINNFKGVRISNRTKTSLFIGARTFYLTNEGNIPEMINDIDKDTIWIIYNENADPATDRDKPVNTDQNIIIQSNKTCGYSDPRYFGYAPSSFVPNLSCGPNRDCIRWRLGPPNNNLGNSLLPHVRYTFYAVKGNDCPDSDTWLEAKPSQLDKSVSLKLLSQPRQPLGNNEFLFTLNFV